jgi:L-ascorbate metabolism protein UlaG (beta-lactamase superfamily)
MTAEHPTPPPPHPGHSGRGERGRGGWRGERGFADRLTAPPPRARDVVRMVRELPPARQRTAGAATIPVLPGPLPAPGPGQASLTWVGHATYVVRLGSLTVLTDPVWSRRIPGTRPRLTPVGLPWESLPRVDAVVISHNHYDHLDAPTIRRLPRDTPILVPAGLGRWFRRRGFHTVVERDWWESHQLGRVRFDFVPAHHWSRRGLSDTCRTLWGGWVLTASDGPRIYFAGDTGYGHFFGQIGSRYRRIDLALMPVGAYEPAWFMRPVHLDPEEAVRACDDLGAARMSTMHWGTFLLSGEPVTEPPERAAKAWAAAGRARDDLWDLAVGESRTL